MTIRSIQPEADPPPHSPRYVVMTITPDIAREMLAHPFDRQRSTARVTIDQYAREMTDGRWFEPGVAPISRTADGKLQDGFHRLHALIKANVTLDMLVDENSPPEAFKYFDRGRKRTAGQFVRRPSAFNIASAARFYLWAKKALPEPPTPMAISFSMDEVLDLLDTPVGDAIEQAIRDAGPPYRTANIPMSIHAAAIVIARERGADQRLVDEWLSGLTEGIGLERGDPRRLLRERMRAHTGGSRRSSASTWSLVVRSFNAWYQGRTMGTLKQAEWDEPSPDVDLLGTSHAAVSHRRRKAASL